MELTNQQIIEALRCTKEFDDCLDCDMFIFCYSPKTDINALLADRLEEQIEPEDDWVWK